jgi:hypothetical protein
VLDDSVSKQINAKIDHGDWFDYKFVGGSDQWKVYGTWTIKSLNQFMVVMNHGADRGDTDGSFQNTCKWLSDTGKISQSKANKWLGYWNDYWTTLWYKQNPGQQPPAGGVPIPSPSVMNDLWNQILAFLKGQKSTTTNAGFFGTYGIPIIALVGGIAILGFAFAPKKGGAPATVPLVKPVIRYRSWPKKRRK